MTSVLGTEQYSAPTREQRFSQLKTTWREGFSDVSYETVIHGFRIVSLYIKMSDRFEDCRFPVLDGAHNR